MHVEIPHFCVNCLHVENSREFYSRILRCLGGLLHPITVLIYVNYCGVIFLVNVCCSIYTITYLPFILYFTIFSINFSYGPIFRNAQIFLKFKNHHKIPGLRMVKRNRFVTENRYEAPTCQI
jgi:hypothetical protein